MPNVSKISRFEVLTSSDVSANIMGRDLIVPVGSIEQHGPHLPLSVDLDLAMSIAESLANRLDGIVAPGINYAARSLPQSGGGTSFPGSIYVPGEILIGYFASVFSGLAKLRPGKLIVINGHFENEALIFEALDQCREKGFLEDVQVIALSWWNVIGSNVLIDCFGDTFPGWHAEHAATVETALMLHLHPKKVFLERMPSHSLPPLEGVFLHPVNPANICNQGVLSDTSRVSVALGKKLFNHLICTLEEIVHKPHGMTSYSSS